MLNINYSLNRRILNWSLAISAAVGILASLPSKTMAITGFTGAYAPGNWTLTNTNADGAIDTTNAASGSIELTGGNNSTSLQGTTDWSITSSLTRTIRFDWIYNTSDTPDNDISGYFINSTFFKLSGIDGQTSGSPQIVNLNSGNIFGFRVRTIDNNGGAGILTISNFDVQATPVPFESSPAVPFTALPVLGLMRFYRQRQKRKTGSLTTIL
jgi:hypothetical protein